MIFRLKINFVKLKVIKLEFQSYIYNYMEIMELASELQIIADIT